VERPKGVGRYVAGGERERGKKIGNMAIGEATSPSAPILDYNYCPPPPFSISA
jgi:hypothetical protein